MNKVTASDNFKRKAKPLAKKYSTLRESIDSLGEKLIKNPYLGESYGSGIYKIRLADESKGSGKRSGFRIMYYLVIEGNDDAEIVLMTIFSKGDLDTVTKKDAVELKKEILKTL